jgi:hypothetical protein
MAGRGGAGLAWLAEADGPAPGVLGVLAVPADPADPAERSQSGKRPARALAASAMARAMATTAMPIRLQNCDLPNSLPLREPGPAGPDRRLRLIVRYVIISPSVTKDGVRPAKVATICICPVPACPPAPSQPHPVRFSGPLAAKAV